MSKGPKLETNSNEQTQVKIPNEGFLQRCFIFSDVRFICLEFVSNFDIRILDFVSASRTSENWVCLKRSHGRH
jgi:hypothetical protein